MRAAAASADDTLSRGRAAAPVYVVLLRVSLFLEVLWAVDDEVPRVIVHEAECDFVERGLDRGDLREHSRISASRLRHRPARSDENAQRRVPAPGAA
jgi:hypothetical protein